MWKDDLRENLYRNPYEDRRTGVCIREEDVHQMSKAERNAFTQKVQTIFQDPYASLDPHQKVYQIVSGGMRDPSSDKK